MGLYDIETKWNADNEKMAIIIALEQKLTEAFMEYDYSSIYTLLRVYRLNADPKFNDTSRKELEKKIDNLATLFKEFTQTKSKESASKFILEAEDFYLTISRALKSAGIYFREGKNAGNAILQK